jgi:hypothetical protein
MCVYFLLLSVSSRLHLLSSSRMTLATCEGGNKFTLSTTFLYSGTTAAPRPRDKTIQQTKRRKADTETQLTFSISVSSQSPNVFPISRPRISLAIHLLESLHSIQLPVYQHRLRRHQRPRLSNFLKPRACLLILVSLVPQLTILCTNHYTTCSYLDRVRQYCLDSSAVSVEHCFFVLELSVSI